MGAMVSQITSLTNVYSTVYSGADQRKHQSSTSLAFMRGIHRWPVNSPHKWPVTRKMCPFDDVIMCKTRTSKGWPFYSGLIISNTKALCLCFSFASTQYIIIHYTPTVEVKRNTESTFLIEIKGLPYLACRCISVVTLGNYGTMKCGAFTVHMLGGDLPLTSHKYTSIYDICVVSEQVIVIIVRIQGAMTQSNPP